MKTRPFSITIIFAGINTCFVLHTNSIAQVRSNESVRASPNAAVTQTIGTTEITITYGRPSVRERVIFGELVPFNEVWRTGANEATTITFSDDVLVEGETLEAGTYGLFTTPRENGNWTLIFNNVEEQWGAYDYDSEEDALRLEVSAENAPHQEQMIIYFDEVSDNSGKAVMHWENVRVAFRIEEG